MAESEKDQKRLPYVGVSGFMSRAEVDQALAGFPEMGRQLMVGVLASSKTLCGKTNKYPRRYPKVEDIAGIFSPDPRCLNLVHVSTDSEPSTIDGKLIPIEIDMMRAFRAGGPLCHGVQLNNATGRVSLKALDAFRGMCPTASRVVLQTGPRWLATRIESDSLSKSLMMYSGVITDILIDASGGRGRAIDPEETQRLVREARSSLAHYGVPDGSIGLGVAGGLCAGWLPRIQRLAVEEAPISIDAESLLRDDTDWGGNLDMVKVHAYLSAAGKLFARPSSEAIVSAARAAVVLVGLEGRFAVHRLAERTIAMELGRALTEPEVAAVEAACDAELSK